MIALTLVPFYTFLMHMLLFFQVTHMLRATQSYQATVTKNGPAGLSHDEAQNACNQLVKLKSRKYVVDSL